MKGTVENWRFVWIDDDVASGICGCGHVFEVIHAWGDVNVCPQCGFQFELFQRTWIEAR
jgi:hypothetical protein